MMKRLTTPATAAKVRIQLYNYLNTGWVVYDDVALTSVSNYQTSTFSYDAENHLTAVTGPVAASFVYDGDGRRVQATVNGVTTAYPGRHFEWSGSTSSMKTYYEVQGQRIAVREGSGTGTAGLAFLLNDHLGSTNASYQAQGAAVSALRYTPWGETRYATGATPTTYRYTGQRAEPELGMYDYNARWLDPALGRFLQADTLVPDPYNPMDWNRYTYVRSNPIIYTDPTGHITQAIFAGDGDVWSPPISSYGVTVSNGWTLEDNVQIASELQIMANTLTSICPDGNCFGMAPHEVFHSVFGDTTISRIYDGNGIGCIAGNPIICSEGTGGHLGDSSQSGLIIHEFGHNFDHKINGWGYARSALANSTISINADHVSGFNPATGTYERTTRGYRSDNYPDVQHPLRKDGNSSGEDFADMFLNYSRGTFATDIYGQARYLWMVGNMSSWMGMISSRWQK